MVKIRKFCNFFRPRAGNLIKGFRTTLLRPFLFLPYPDKSEGEKRQLVMKEVIILLTFQSVDDAWRKLDCFASRFNTIAGKFGRDKKISRDQSREVIAKCDGLTVKMNDFRVYFEREVKSFDAANDYRLAAKAVEVLCELLSLENEILVYRSRFA